MNKLINQEVNIEVEDTEESDIFEVDEETSERMMSLINNMIEEDGDCTRNIHFNNDVSDSYLDDTLKKLIKWETQDLGLPENERMPINFYLNSNGGYLTTGFALIDFIREMKTPVNMIVTKAYSMATTMLVSVPLERRFMFENGTILIHEVSGGISGGLTKMCNDLDFSKRISDICDNIITKNTLISKKKLRKKKKNEWYIFAEEAQELGIIGFIIGKDCSLQEIL